MIMVDKITQPNKFKYDNTFTRIYNTIQIYYNDEEVKIKIKITIHG